MPLNSAQLAALVERARHKAPPVISPPPPPQRSVRPRQAKPAPPAASPPPESQRPAPAAVPPSLPAPDAGAHRRGRGLPRRLGAQEGLLALPPPVLCGVPPADGARRILAPAPPDPAWSGRASREGCWRVTLPGGSRTLPVRATPWRLITILPKNWQPSGPASHQTVAASPPRQTSYADVSAPSEASAAVSSLQ